MSDYLRDAGPGDITLPVDHLSASQVSMLQRCHEQYRQRYVLGKKEKPGAALIVGVAFHKAIEADFSYKIDLGQLCNDKTIVDLYNAEFDEILENNGGVNEIVWDEKEKPDMARKHGQGCVEQYHSQVAPKLEPESVEYEFSKEIKGVPVPVVGRIDLVAHRLNVHNPLVYGPDAFDSQGNQRTTTQALVADYKTANRAKRQIQPDWRFQGETYQWVSGRPVEWHVAVKSSRPSIITPLESPELLQSLSESVKPSVELRYTHAAKLIGWLMREFGPDESWPTTGYSHPWSCSYCGFQKDCVAWKR